MILTIMAEWLDQIFKGFDYAILSALHSLAEVTNGKLTPFFVFISFLANHGVILILFAAILLAFKNTRRIGLCMIFAITFGAILTNVILKESIVRARPYMDATNDYYIWWQSVGGIVESGFSFPSGHTTAMMAAVTAIYLNIYKKKYSYLVFILAVLMGVSRNYLMVHYPTDVIGGFIIGAIGALLSYYLIDSIYRYITTNPTLKTSKILLDADIRNRFNKNKL